MNKEEGQVKIYNILVLGSIFVSVLLWWLQKYWLIALIAVLNTVITYWVFGASKNMDNKSKQMIYKNFNECENITLEILPQPVVMTDKSGQILWYNKMFANFLGKKEKIRGKISQYFPLLLFEESEFGQVKSRRITFRDKIIDVTSNIAGEANNLINVLIFTDITEQAMENQASYEQSPVIALLELDNLAEALQSIEEEYQPMLIGELDRILSEWAADIEGYLKKNSDERYLLILNNKGFREIEKTKFDILDKIREVDLGNKLPVTLSIGFGIGSESSIDLGRLGVDALQLALERGGDQVVVKSSDNIWYFGGKTKSTERRTKVKARVNAYNLRELILVANNVVIMGHEFADYDSIGASVGLAKAVSDFGKNGYILIDQKCSSLNKLKEVLPSIAIKQKWIKVNEAKKIIDENTLLIIVDTHKPSLLLESAFLEKTDNIVVIDHHRRGKEFINNAKLVYIETYASSASELVTELLQYLGDEVELEENEATALLAGITMDTKHFVSQTGVRTFEAATYLRRQGADPEKVQQSLKDDFSLVTKKAQIINNAKIVCSGIVVAEYPEVLEEAHILAAQTADSLMNIKGIIASFVLCQTADYVTISARSDGNINVQVIMEKIGGGGHLTIAAAQVKDSLHGVKEKLFRIIEDYIMEEAK